MTPSSSRTRLGRSALLIALALPLAACSAGYRGTAVISSGSYVDPSLVAVGGGIYVVEDYDDPVFFADSYYWRAGDDGRWSRSRYHDRGYSYARPPQAVARIEQPGQYRHYRGAAILSSRDRAGARAGAGDRRYVRDRSGGVRVRDHRR